MSANGLPSLRRLIVPLLFVAALFAIVIFRRPPQPEQSQWIFSGPTMGTVYTVKIVAPLSRDGDRERIAALVGERLEEVNRCMSTYRPDSEIEAFNRHGTSAFGASPDLLEVVAEAQRVSRLSGGAFDITVGSLVDAWGFGPSHVTKKPSDETVRALRAATGFERLEVDEDGGTLRKERADIRIDLSAIAKGFGVDEVAEALDGEAFRDYMVEVGGEVRARGKNLGGTSWRIGIERPDESGRAVHLAIPLADLALATSGDYRNFVSQDGVRISHTIDPRTGRPIAHALASVSVLNRSCMTADALATALEVLGPDEGIALAGRQEIPALFLIRVGEGEFEERRTARWAVVVENTPGTGSVS
jgi:thiamine biosynthesis lipoprotein